MAKLPFELAQPIILDACRPSHPRIKHSAKPFEDPHLMAIANSIEDEYAHIEITKAHLSSATHQSHNAIQPLLSQSLSLCSTNAVAWPNAFSRLTSTSPLFRTDPSNPPGLYTIKYTDESKMLHTPVNHIQSLASLSITITNAISPDILDTYRDVFVPSALNIRSLSVNIPNVDRNRDYYTIVSSILSVVHRIHTLDWSSNYSDSNNIFCSHLAPAKKLRRLNLSLASAKISRHRQIHNMFLLDLECVQITTKHHNYGDQYDFLVKCCTPLLRSLLVYGVGSYDILFNFIHKHRAEIHNLFIENLPFNLDIVRECKYVRTLVTSADFPLYKCRLPQFSRRLFQNRKISRIMIVNDKPDTTILSELSDIHRFPSLHEIRLLQFQYESPSTELSKWIIACEQDDIKITDKTGNEINTMFNSL